MKNTPLQSKSQQIKQKFLYSIRGNFTTWTLSIIIVLSIFKDLEFLALMGLILLLVRNDQQLGIRLRQLFVKVGKEGFEFRDPPEEAATADKESPQLQINDESQDYLWYGEANRLLQQNRLQEAEQKYNQVINEGSDESVIKDSYLNLGVVYLKIWHQTHNDDLLKKSIEASKKAIEHDPNGYRSRLNLGVAYSKKKETESDALNYFEEADSIGDMSDPITWGKVKLFKASTINSLSTRQDGEKYADKLREAEVSLLESIRFFETMSYHPEAPWLTHEASSLLDVLRRKIAQKG